MLPKAKDLLLLNVVNKRNHALEEENVMNQQENVLVRETNSQEIYVTKSKTINSQLVLRLKSLVMDLENVT